MARLNAESQEWAEEQNRLVREDPDELPYWELPPYRKKPFEPDLIDSAKVGTCLPPSRSLSRALGDHEDDIRAAGWRVGFHRTAKSRLVTFERVSGRKGVRRGEE